MLLQDFIITNLAINTSVSSFLCDTEYQSAVMVTVHTSKYVGLLLTPEVFLPANQT